HFQGYGEVTVIWDRRQGDRRVAGGEVRHRTSRGWGARRGARTRGLRRQKPALEADYRPLAVRRRAAPLNPT
ncbi:MAG TPA: hypothetical protein VGX21_09550, partial [Methylomirabilota bacterium]|nr:hypothetical protein [Methylomirabilota bacterium]